MNTLIVSALLVFVLQLNVANCIPFDNGDEMNNPLFEQNYSPYKMPAGCEDETYCLVKGDDYPEDSDIEELMKKYYSYLKKGDQKIEYSHRLADEQLKSECGDKFIKAPIYYIKDTSNRTRAVVQSTSLGEDLYYLQEYELRWCKNEGPKTSTRNIFKTNLALHDLRMTCKTTYLTFDFHVISTGEELEMEIARAKIPVCCKCSYIKP